MKEAGTDHWDSPNIGAINSSGFTGIPGRFRSESGSFGGIWGLWWKSNEYTENGANSGLCLYLTEEDPIAHHSGFDKRFGVSIRCVRELIGYLII